VGGTTPSSVTKDLSFLVLGEGDPYSSKAKKAEKYGVPVISEEEFLELIGIG
jgi:NAD-dependent DNA ligase